jgi:hypothetical protein
MLGGSAGEVCAVPNVPDANFVSARTVACASSYTAVAYSQLPGQLTRTSTAADLEKLDLARVGSTGLIGLLRLWPDTSC